MRLHLVDGTYELVRAHFAPGPSRRDAVGRDVKACVGMMSSLVKLLHDSTEDVTHIAVAFDDPVESFRNRVYPAYKSSDALPPDVLQQFGLAQQGIKALGVTLWPQDEFEADDAIATAALWGQTQFDAVRILSPDKDFGQLVNDRITQVDRSRNREFDEAGVIERLGVPPAAVALFLAIAGDAADGISGVPRFGETTAATLLNRYPTLCQIPQDCDAWDVALRGRQKLCEIFNTHRDDVEVFLSLTTLRTDVPLQLDRDTLHFAGVPHDSFVAWCEEVQAESLKTRPTRWLLP